MTFKEKIISGNFVITSEVGPPKGIGTEGMLAGAKVLGARVDAINVTDQQSSVMRMGSLAGSIVLKQHGYEPVFQITCRDRNRIALQSDILSAAAFGVQNLLILTGDHPSRGDHPEAKPVFDLDSVQLMQVVRGFNEGFDMKGNALQGAKPEFLAGAVVNPGSDPLEPQILKMEKKIAAGARFFQTQAVYDVKIFERFLSGIKHLGHVPIIAGIVLLKSAAMARYMNKNVPGVSVPEHLIREMEQAKDKAAASVTVASRLIKELKGMCQGVHIMPIGWDHIVPKVLDASGL